MLFNSIAYIAVFFPITVAGYFLINRFGWYRQASLFLVIASLVFYSIGGWRSLPVILASIIINYAIGTALTISPKHLEKPRKSLLIIGIGFNLCLLGYFKYAGFIVENINWFGSHIYIGPIVLPLALSFVTFQKIAYLVDSYRYQTKGYGVVGYALFVTFFPQLIAGPIVHHSDLVPQFRNHDKRRPHLNNMLLGLFIFSGGLFKKVILADNIAQWVSPTFDHAVSVNFVKAWIAALAFTFQLYFDFSGYVDMAIGSALFFNIALPINFNSPYRALSIQDFWRRWHMTLSRFLRDYLYIPLGGNRNGELATYANLLATFVLGGLWHGASWMFVIWGAMHGVALILHRAWTRAGLRLPVVVAWFLTFIFVVFTWVFFRATSLESAMRIIVGMMSPGDGSLRQIIETPFVLREFLRIESPLFSCTWLVGAGVIVLLCPTTVNLFKGKEQSPVHALFAGCLFAVSFFVLISLQASPSEFLYFNF